MEQKKVELERMEASAYELAKFISDILKEKFDGKVRFCLIAASNECEAFTYVSNIQRESCIELLKEATEKITADTSGTGTLGAQPSEKEKREPSLKEYLQAEIQFAKMMRQAEVIGGNVVKEALWQGEMTAFRKMVAFLHYRAGDDTYRELLKEI